MNLLRQGRYFVGIGLLQWLVDWGVMVTLSHFGLAIVYANLAGRVSGALLGFSLNGRITFARDGATPGWRQFRRYVIWWAVSALFSTSAVTAIDTGFGLRVAWLGKPLVDGLLAIAGFVISRHWVYR